MRYRKDVHQSYGKHHHPQSPVSYSLEDLRRIHASRSSKARVIDEKLKAKLAPSDEAWIKSPNRYDIEGIDFPTAQKVQTYHQELYNTGQGLPDYYRGSHTFKVNTKDLEAIKQELDSLETPEYFKLNVHVDSGPRVSTIYVDVYSPPIAVDLRGSWDDFYDAKRIIENIEKGLNKKVMDIMKKYGAEIKLYGDYTLGQPRDKYVFLSEYVKEMDYRVKVKPAMKAVMAVANCAQHPVKHKNVSLLVDWQAIREGYDHLPADYKEILKENLQRLSKAQIEDLQTDSVALSVYQKILGRNK